MNNLLELESAFTLFRDSLSDRVEPSDRLQKLNSFFRELCRIAGIDPDHHPDLTTAAQQAAESIKGRLQLFVSSHPIESSARFSYYLRSLHSLGARDPGRLMVSAGEFQGEKRVLMMNEQMGLGKRKSMVVPYDLLKKLNHSLAQHIEQEDCFVHDSLGASVVIEGVEPVEFKRVVEATKKRQAERVEEVRRLEAESRSRAMAEQERARLRRELDPEHQRRMLEERVRVLEQEKATRERAASSATAVPGVTSTATAPASSTKKKA